MDAVNTTRAVTVAVAAVIFLWVLSRAWRQRNEYPPEVVLLLQALSFYVFGVAYGTAELLWWPGVNFRAFVFPVANVTLLVTLFVTSRKAPFRKEL